MTEQEFDNKVMERFLEVGYAKNIEEANKFMNWAYGEAFFDGQRGWNLDYDKDRLTESFAIYIADRAIETWKAEEEEC